MFNNISHTQTQQEDDTLWKTQLNMPSVCVCVCVCVCVRVCGCVCMVLVCTEVDCRIRAWLDVIVVRCWF